MASQNATLPPEDAPSPLEGPAGAVRKAGTFASTSVDTAIRALRSEEASRARGFARATGTMALATLLFLPLLGGAPWLHAAMAVGLTAIIAVSIWIFQAARNGRYSDRRVFVYGTTCVAASVVFNYYLGVLSPTPVIVTVGISFFGLGANRRLAVLFPVIATLGWFVLCALTLSGMLPDAGILAARTAPPVAQLFFLVMVPLVFAVTLYQARHSRRATLEAIERSNQALREMLQREAQLDEANRNLEVALAAGAGHEGRHTGSLAGRYRLAEVLGRGAMAEVYAARHEETGQPAAVKILHPDVRRDAEAVQRLLREGAATSKLRVPCVVSVFEVGQLEDGAPFIAMELLTGHDLAWHLRQQREVSLGDVLVILDQIAPGLEAARLAGIVHRDLKPQNLFLAESGGVAQWKIVDFGVSKLARSSGTLTQDAVVGTPGYMSPEQARGLAADHRSDLFAVGAVAYRALTGRAPFSGPDLPRILFDVVYRSPARPRELVPTLPSDVDLVMAVALAKKPSDRFQTAPELCHALHAAGAGKLDDRLRAHAVKLVRAFPWGEVADGRAVGQDAPPRLDHDSTIRPRPWTSG